MALKSLPDRPLRRTEIDDLGETETIDGIYPIYGERSENRDTAIGAVILINATAHALAYTHQDGWTRVDKRDTSGSHGGIHIEETNKIEELWDAITEHLESEPVSSPL